MDREFRFLRLGTISLILVAPMLQACGSSGDSAFAGAPDVTGSYNILLEGGNGCADDKGNSTVDYWTGWAAGPLHIDGDNASSLTYDFGTPMIFDGLVDGTWSFQFAGDKDWTNPEGAPANISVSGSGVFTVAEDGGNDIDGQLEILVDDNGIKSDNCKVTADFSGYQI
jgi:hypothetical protein